MTDGASRGLMASSNIPVAKPEEVNAAYCLEFLRRIRDVVFATVDASGLPSARVIDVMHVEDGRLYFLVPRGKAFFAELKNNPVVSIVGQTTDFRTCRLRGVAVRAADDEQRRLVDKMFKLNAGMEELYPGESRYVCQVFYLEQGCGDYFDLGQKPIVRVQFDLGGEVPHMGGSFEISDECAGCGVCREVCPQNCIGLASDGRSSIQQEACLRCGLCREACPHDAIMKR